MFPPASESTATLEEELATSERLSRMQGQEIGPSDVIRVLQRAKIPHVLVGAHAISAWAGKPRATVDVDVIASRPASARKALAEAFPELEISENPVVIRFKREQQEVIDVIKPSSSAIFKAALKHSTRLKIGKIQTDVPTLEAALALKFASMISRTRRVADRHIDVHDFIHMVEHNASIDLAKLNTFGELVYTGGGTDILKLVADARMGRELVI